MSAAATLERAELKLRLAEVVERLAEAKVGAIHAAEQNQDLRAQVAELSAERKRSRAAAGAAAFEAELQRFSLGLNYGGSHSG